jgi:hypothetical protein
MSNSILIEAYCQVGVPLNRLPYTESFAHLRELVECASGERLNDRELWDLYRPLHENGELPKFSR